MSFRIAVSATFTAEPIASVLDFWGRQLQSPFDLRFAPYNQLLQSLLDPTGEFATNPHGANVLLVRLEDLGQFDGPTEATLTRIESNLNDLVRLIRGAPQSTSVPLLFVLCPPSPEFMADPLRARFANDGSLRAAAMLEGTPGVFCLTDQEIQRHYPVADPSNPEGERLGRIPYTDLYFAALGTAVVRLTHGLSQPPFKVIALDCDNTLWKGICGEDGPQSIVVDAPRRRLQQFMGEQREDGMLLVLASKNNQQDVFDTFQHNPEMPLQLRHFVGWRLNWESKCTNLIEMANELSLGLDSFIFIDDNPKECAEVEQGTPEVLALALPGEDHDIPTFLEHVWAFDHLLVTEEDRHRSAYYAQARDFGRELKRAESMEHFLATLDLEVRLSPLTPDKVARVSQLTQRTNQFNFTTLRKSEAEVRALTAQRAYECLTVDVSDRFGDYGLTGVVIFQSRHGALEIETFLLSCRVLGRGVEHRILASLAEEAMRRGLHEVTLRYEPTKRNEPARQFLDSLIKTLALAGQVGPVYHFPALELRQLTWTANAAEVLENPAPVQRKPAPPPAARKRPEYARIARDLSRPSQILEAVRAESRLNSGEGLSDTETRLAEIWSELLRRPDIASTNNFFDLGGHSLMVVLLIVRIRETFGVQMAIDDVYAADLTLRDLAHKIDILQLGGDDEYQALMREIENMSEEEAARLLAEEDPEFSGS